MMHRWAALAVLALGALAPTIGQAQATQNPPPARERPGVELGQNYPNPFNPTTQVRYDVGTNAHVKIAIYDVRGALVRTLVDQERSTGSYIAVWDGRRDSGARAASGVYFCSMRAGEFVESRRMVLLK